MKTSPALAALKAGMPSVGSGLMSTDGFALLTVELERSLGIHGIDAVSIGPNDSHAR